MIEIFSSSLIESGVQIAIGILFIFVLLGFMVAQISTIIINLLNLRAKQLKRGLESAITDATILAKLLAHPLVQLVDKSIEPTEHLTEEQADAIITESPPTRVSYVPPDIFVEALIGILTAGTKDSIYKPLEDAMEALPENDDKLRLRNVVRRLADWFTLDTDALHGEILQVRDDSHRKQLLSALYDLQNTFRDYSVKNPELYPLVHGIANIRNVHFRTALATIVAPVRSLDEARVKLEVWYNYNLVRISDNFRQNLQYVILVIGLTLALLLNVDSLYILSQFSRNPEINQAITAAARNINPQEALTNVPNAGATPSPSIQSTAEPGITVLSPTEPIIPESEFAAPAQAVEDLLRLQLPLGWEYIPVTDELIDISREIGLPNPLYSARNAWNFSPGNNPNWLSLLIQKFIGIALTTILVAQFAPLLFDLTARVARSAQGSASSE